MLAATTVAAYCYAVEECDATAAAQRFNGRVH